MRLIQKHRIYPNKEHREFLEKQFGCCRFVWNYFVNLFEREGSQLSYYEMAERLVTEVNPQFTFLEEVAAQCLQQTLRDLRQSVRQKIKPKFKKKHWRQSCRYAQYTKLDRNKQLLYLPKMMDNPIKIILERELPEYTMCTIVKESDGRYYACFWIEKEHIEHVYNPNLKHLGLDVGIKDYLVTSEGERIANPKFYRKVEENIKRKNKALSAKQRGSRRWLKCKRRLSRAHARVRRQRMDFIHKLTSQIASNDNVQGVSVESLSIKKMLKNRGLSKSIHDASWYLLIQTLVYKLEMRGKSFQACGLFFPSTQTCSNCNYLTGPTTLKTRAWICDHCGVQHDRDINAAINIAREGDRLYV